MLYNKRGKTYKSIENQGGTKLDTKVLRALSYGLYALGTKDSKKPTGCIINTVFQITSEPKRIAVSVNKDNYTNGCIQEVNYFTVSVLSEEIDPAIIGTLGFQSGKDVDKFQTVPHQLTDLGLPYIKEKTCGYLQCKVLSSMDCGTHTLFLGEVIDGETYPEYKPMTYDYYHNVIKGKTPKNAPSYVALEEEKEASGTEKEIYVCSICKYEYTEGKESFDALPDDWRCPICGAPKSKFEVK